MSKRARSDRLVYEGPRRERKKAYSSAASQLGLVVRKAVREGRRLPKDIYNALDPAAKAAVKASAQQGNPFSMQGNPISYAHFNANVAGGRAPMSGFGDYKDTLRGIGSALVPKGTFNSIGSRFGGPIGGWAGSKLADLFGFGDYGPSGSMMAAKHGGASGMFGGTAVPRISNGMRSTIIHHREYIKDIQSTAANTFEIQKFEVNPGLTQTFPWLSKLALNYEQYKLRGMVFQYVSQAGNSLATSGSIGTIIMASDYNVLNPDFSSKQGMEQSEFAVSDKISCNLTHGIECARKDTPIDVKFIRQAGVPVSDIRFNDHCNVYVATAGIPTAGITVCGELWVSYEVELIKPILASSIKQSSQHLVNLELATATITNANPWGTVLNNLGLLNSTVQPNGLGSILSPSYANASTIMGFTAAGTLTMQCKPATQYKIRYQWFGGAAALVAPLRTYTGATLANLLANKTGSALFGFTSGLAGQTSLLLEETVLTGATISNFIISLGAAGTLPTAPTFVSVVISELANQA